VAEYAMTPAGPDHEADGLPSASGGAGPAEPGAGPAERAGSTGEDGPAGYTGHGEDDGEDDDGVYVLA
jgi:hypothetical protein